jgi:hypothetical protein
MPSTCTVRPLLTSTVSPSITRVTVTADPVAVVGATVGAVVGADRGLDVATDVDAATVLGVDELDMSVTATTTKTPAAIADHTLYACRTVLLFAGLRRFVGTRSGACYRRGAAVISPDDHGQARSARSVP